MKKIIFVCTGNTCRSPMAMAVLNKKLAEKNIVGWTSDSAGLACAGGKISSNSARALEKIGIILNDYQSKQLDFDMIDSAELLVVMTEGHKSALLLTGLPEEKIRVLGAGISDPYGGDLAVYQNCLKKIEKGIDALIEEGVFS